MIIQNLADVTVTSLLNVWGGVIETIPSLIGALIIAIVGLVVATVVGSVIEKAISSLKIDGLLRKIGLETYFDRAGLKLNTGRFIGALVYWFLIIAFALAIVDMFESLGGISQFLRQVVSYIPNIIAAVLIMVVTVLIGNALRSLVQASAMGAKLNASNFLGSLTWWATVVFGFITALIQLGIAPMLLNTIITGLVAMIALAGGIAFGLGGKDYATHLIGKLRDRIE